MEVFASQCGVSTGNHRGPVVHVDSEMDGGSPCSGNLELLCLGQDSIRYPQLSSHVWGKSNKRDSEFMFVLKASMMMVVFSGASNLSAVMDSGYV